MLGRQGTFMLVCIDSSILSYCHGTVALRVDGEQCATGEKHPQEHTPDTVTVLRQQ
jgi:hypothetical protein